MAQPVIAPLIPNIGPLGEAIASSSAAVFTATDRQIIKERAGEIDHNRSFKELFAGKELLPKVENEETNVNPEQDIKALEGRYREHQHIVKHSVVSVPHEHVEITNAVPDRVVSAPAIVVAAPEVKIERTEAHKQTLAIAKELNLNAAEIFDKFALEQQELYHLISRVKELHLKRLLASTREEFNKLTENIKRETLGAGHPEAKDWIEAQLDILTKDAVEYRAKLGE